jgi:hypothetical protein
MPSQPAQLPLILDISTPPNYCQYAEGPCDQNFGTAVRSDALFLYASEPVAIANPIESAVQHLRIMAGDKTWVTWKDLGVSGQIIFCEICKAIRFTRLVIADVTTLNFNLVFEIGYALGLGAPILPIRDTSYIRDKKVFDELGILDTFGYFDFQNSHELQAGILERQNLPPLGLQRPGLNTAQPLYVVKSPVENDGMVKIMSIVKKSALKFRTFDSREVARISLHEAYKQVMSSRALVLHLLSPERGEVAHNARCAFMAGMGMAARKHVLMLQEGAVRHAIDFRDVVRTYTKASQILDLITPLMRAVIEELQTTTFIPTTLPLKPLEKIDLGDLAAENEIKALESYFVPTAQFQEVKRGHARLVVGRKGAGKTAIFYGVRSTYRPGKRSHLVLDLKPEGHQFTKLRESVMAEMTEGVQQHVLTAFWNYLLLMELAHQIVHYETGLQYRDAKLKAAFENVEAAYGEDEDAEQADFSERLLKLVSQIEERRKAAPEPPSSTGEITQLIHTRDIRKLNDALTSYFSLTRRDIWLLFDNLDKGWPVRAARPEDILLLRCLLEATRKLQRQFESRSVELHSVVFIRNDIYEHLIMEPADRGKDTPVILDWNDPEVFKDILRRRIGQSTGLQDMSFDDLWAVFFDLQVQGQSSFHYILGRTLMRPREVIRFVRECINVAINRNHERVTENDILHAERSYSEDALVDITLEMKDVKPEYADVPYGFISAPAILSRAQVDEKLREVRVPAEELESVIQLLLWFGFLGIYVNEDDERYAYLFEHNVKRMQSGLPTFAYCVHPAFRASLGIHA